MRHNSVGFLFCVLNIIRRFISNCHSIISVFVPSVEWEIGAEVDCSIAFRDSGPDIVSEHVARAIWKELKEFRYQH